MELVSGCRTEVCISGEGGWETRGNSAYQVSEHNLDEGLKWRISKTGGFKFDSGSP